MLSLQPRVFKQPGRKPINAGVAQAGELAGVLIDRGGYPQQHGSKHFVINIEVVVPVTAALGPQDHVFGVRSRKFRWRNAKARTALVAHHDIVETIARRSFAPLQKRTHHLFLAFSRGRPNQWNAVIRRVTSNPSVVIVAARTQDLLGNLRYAAPDNKKVINLRNLLVEPA